MIPLRLPSLGSDMDFGTLLRWQVAPGDRVTRGQVVAVVDTAKAAIDVECWHDGTVHALLVEPGTTLPVGSLMAALRSEGESPEAAEQALALLRRQDAAAGAAAGAEAGSVATRHTPCQTVENEAGLPSSVAATGLQVLPESKLLNKPSPR